MSTRALLPAWAVGEFAGTALLVFFGCGSVAAATLLGAQVGVFQVAIVWGVGIALAIHLTGGLSGAHLNPAVTLALVSNGTFPWRRAAGYVAVQMLGAFAASVLLYLIYGGALEAYEAKHAIVRGAPGSEATAMIFGEYFPNPGGRPLDAVARAAVSPLRAFGIEVAGTAVLVLVILGLTHPRNPSRPAAPATPLLIGLTVTLLISLLGPLTMCGLNPARDLGPRLFSALVGWGGVPFSANGLGWLTVYVLAPLLGGQLGAWIFRRVLAPCYEAGTPNG
ncbi:MAG TPA: MIP family channel protein [Opitutaceae bacterium]